MPFWKRTPPATVRVEPVDPPAEVLAAMSAPPTQPPAAVWSTITGLVAWLDRSNGRDEHELTLRILKIGEELGEVVQARIGTLGQNPRKGRTHTSGDVADELVDVIVTAMVALGSVTDDPAAVFEAKLRAIADRVAGLEARDA